MTIMMKLYLRLILFETPPRYLGVKMYLVRLREPPQPKTDWGVKGVAGLVIKMMDVMNNGGNG